MNLRNAALLTAACLALAGCFGPPAQSLQADPDAKPSLETARTIFANRTNITYSPLFGTQIEYHHPDGRSFLWFPGNTRPVPARWKVQSYAFNDYEICWQYPSSSRNAVTGARGGRWECTPGFAYKGNLTTVLQGDPFGLATMQVPYRIPNKANYSAAQLMATAKRNPASLRYVFRKK